MLVKDEADIIGPVVRHALAEVDAAIVADNGSTDGTRAALERLAGEYAGRLEVRDDPEVGYWQARKTTELAVAARRAGHEWVVPCDADEVWYSPDGRRVADFLAGLAPDVARVRALLYNHFPTPADRGDPDPLVRIAHRHRQHQPAQFGKVACRLLPGLQIQPGNHAALLVPETTGPSAEVGGLELRHFSWRSPGQYLRKIRNGERAYAATNLPDVVGQHWRGFAGKPDEAVVGWYRQWALKDPRDPDLVRDPAPVRA